MCKFDIIENVGLCLFFWLRWKCVQKYAIAFD